MTYHERGASRLPVTVQYTDKREGLVGNKTDRLTDRPTDRPTDRQLYRDFDLVFKGQIGLIRLTSYHQRLDRQR